MLIPGLAIEGPDPSYGYSPRTTVCRRNRRPTSPVHYPRFPGRFLGAIFPAIAHITRGYCRKAYVCLVKNLSTGEEDTLRLMVTALQLAIGTSLLFNIPDHCTHLAALCLAENTNQFASHLAFHHLLQRLWQLVKLESRIQDNLIFTESLPCLF